MDRALLAAWLLVVTAVASNTGTGSDIPEMQKFLFEISTVNYAWGRVIRGLYVDSHGGVHEYNHSYADWLPSGMNAYSQAELSDKFDKKQQKTTIDAATLARMYKLIEPASMGELTLPTHRCFDAGVTSYVAYSYDQKSQRYKSVLLYQAGDIAQKNLSESAKTLYEWLFSFSGGRPSFCAP
jgi:hypothetical protein